VSDSNSTRTLPDWPNQQLRGHALEGPRYTSKEFFDKEWEGMWTKVWLLLGREDEMPEPGNWQREDVGPESILMVRQDDGSVRAYYNICQHRGNKLVTEPKGHVNRFVCPYHAWAWSRDGELDYVQDADDFPQGDPCGKLQLQQVRCETFAGFIWINMDPDCVGLREFLGPIWDDWEGYGIEKWKRYYAGTATVPFNWKVILDNFNESYHVPTVHRARGSEAEKKRFHPGIDTNYKNTRFDLSDEGHNRMIMRGGYAGPTVDNDGYIGEPLASVMREWELDPLDFRNRGEDTRAALQEAKRRVGAKRGYDHYAHMADEQLTDALHYTLFPNFAVSLWSDGFHFLRARPHPTDPEQCIFDNWWYASQPVGETAPVRTTANVVERDTEVEHQVYEYGDHDMGITINQDLEIMPGQQAGFRSRGYKGAYLAGQESRLSRYHELIDDYIEGKQPVRK
jgi:phenylpropionate dioxygenase-like ring-hydroxylating dioxygenase large terminal subunit